jgi:hypothetical protein
VNEFDTYEDSSMNNECILLAYLRGGMQSC